MSLRTKSIEDAFRLEYRMEAGAHYVDYQPGNGTRYCLLIVHSTAPLTPTIDPGGYLVTDLNSGRSMLLQPGGFLHFRYVKEKLNLRSEADAVVVAELLGHLTGRPCVSCEDYATSRRRLDNPNPMC